MKDEIIRRYLEGAVPKDIALLYNVCERTIYDWLEKWGVKLRGKNEYFKYNFNNEYFKEIDCEDKAYWLGFITADGCIFKSQLSIGISVRDLSHLQLLRKHIEGKHPITFCKNICRIRFVNADMILDLNRLGVFPRKTFTVKPAILREDLLRHYWRGLVDGDGWLNVDGKSVSLCGNYEIVRGFRNWCLTLNRKITSDLVSHSSIYQFTVTGKIARPILESLYGDSNVYLARKFEKYQEIIDQ